MQIKQDDMFPADLPALHNFLLAALLAPAHLGVTPPEAQTARRLATKAGVLQSADVPFQGPSHTFQISRRGPSSGDSEQASVECSVHVQSRLSMVRLCWCPLFENSTVGAAVM